jgi:hypothetical protein
LIKEVWNNYGGSDEGLSQAISFLRKVLDDQKKHIIETVPTKGYLLKATISDVAVAKESKPYKHIYWRAGLVLIVIVAAITLYYRPWEEEYKTQLQPMPNMKTEVKPDIIWKPKVKSQPLDTIIIKR